MRGPSPVRRKRPRLKNDSGPALRSAARSSADIIVNAPSARSGPGANERLSPDNLLTYQRTLGNRAVSRMISGSRTAPPAAPAPLQRRELATAPSTADTAAPAEAKLDKGDWLISDRTGNTDRWKEACEYNLVNTRSDHYTQVAERRDFYKWFYDATAAKGYHTRWALAAYIVASGMAEMVETDWVESVSPITNEMQGLARIGNQIIFDDVLPKLRKLWLNPPLKGQAAIDADAAILADEQQLVQAMYSSLDAATMKRFGGIASMSYIRAKIAQGTNMAGVIDAGPYNRGADVPPFTGDINKPEDRWNYGMMLAEQFSTINVEGSVGTMPTPGEAYSSGSQFAALNVRPHLHKVDAMLNDANVPDADIVAELKLMTPSEQRELMSDTGRAKRLGAVLNYAEMLDVVENLGTLSLFNKFWLLDEALTRSWTSVDYDEVQALIRAAPSDQKAAMATEFWKGVFVDICDNDTIYDAVNDLGFTDPVRQEWIDAEH